MKSLRQYHAKAIEFAQRALADEQARHGALERCLRGAPGSLVEQWQTSPSEKFELRLEPLTHSHVESTATGNPSVKDPLWIARRDQLSRKTEWEDKPCLLKIEVLRQCHAKGVLPPQYVAEGGRHSGFIPLTRESGMREACNVVARSRFGKTKRKESSRLLMRHE
jgi:hypothetical protein